MKSMIAPFFLAAGLAGLWAPGALAQDPDKAAQKKKLLEQVEKRLQEEQDRLLKDLEKVIDEELARRKSGAPAPEPRTDPPKKADPAPQAKKKARGYLGIRPGDLSDDEKKALGITSGIKVVEVVDGGPAAKAGLQAEDVITTINGKAIESPQEVPGIVQNAGAGSVLKLDVLREGKKKTFEVTLARHPADTEQAQAPSPKEDPKGGDLRERVKKFLNKEEEPKPAPKAEEKKDDLFAFDESVLEQLQPLFEQFGMDPDQFFEKGKDGKYRLNEQYRQMLKGLDLQRFFKGGVPKEETPTPSPQKARKPEAPKETPKAGPVKPWLGIQAEELPDELRAQLDLEEGTGLLVADVLAGGPAAKGGLKKNDILVKIDGRPVKGEESLIQFIQSAKIGQEVTLTLLRKSKEVTLKLTLAERKE
jgi:C-terminal processing protease CtpA/Prc